MESRKIQNLFVAGEILNIDAITGGFNFQACWSEGFWSLNFSKARFNLLNLSQLTLADMKIVYLFLDCSCLSMPILRKRPTGFGNMNTVMKTIISGDRVSFKHQTEAILYCFFRMTQKANRIQITDWSNFRLPAMKFGSKLLAAVIMITL